MSEQKFWGRKLLLVKTVFYKAEKCLWVKVFLYSQRNTDRNFEKLLLYRIIIVKFSTTDCNNRAILVKILLKLYLNKNTLF